MITAETFRKMALSFPEAVELPHFERTSFRVKNKIFATLAENTEIATLKLPDEAQSILRSIDNTAIYPVPNKWGTQGWTFIELKKVSRELVRDALGIAYDEVSKKKSKGSRK